MGNYRELEVWKRGRVLAREVYRETRSFPRTEMFGIVQQMRRAAVSIISNIAEGHGRGSVRERLHFLMMSRGSLFELQAQIIIAADLDYVTEHDRDGLLEHVIAVSKPLHGLIRHYQNRLR